MPEAQLSSGAGAPQRMAPAVPSPAPTLDSPAAPLAAPYAAGRPGGWSFGSSEPAQRNAGRYSPAPGGHSVGGSLAGGRGCCPPAVHERCPATQSVGSIGRQAGDRAVVQAGRWVVVGKWAVVQAGKWIVADR